MTSTTPSSETTYTLLIAEEDMGKRLDQFISENTDLSRTFCQKLIKGGAVCVGEKMVKKVAFSLKLQQEVSVQLPQAQSLDIAPEDISLDILYEDEDVIVVNKPANMVVHPDDTYHSGTLVNALLGHLGSEHLSGIGGVKRPGIVHRLDKNTSGVMIVAKHDRAHRHLSQQIAERKTTKIYTALVFGKMKHDQLSIEAPIERDPKDRKRMTVSGAPSARDALTHVERQEFFSRHLCSLLRVNIVTGRTHQIRVHLSSVGFPVVSDPLYGDEKRNEKFEKNFPLERIFLHSTSLTITLPNGEQREFVAPLPTDLSHVLEMVRLS